MWISYILFAVGLLCLMKGGDWFVDGSVAIAERFHLSEILIGATVVSIGTTLPEVMVSVTSAVSGHGDMAYGNAIGSIICNTALIAAITMAFRPGKIDKKSFYLSIGFFTLAALFYVGIAYTTGNFSRVTGVLLLVMFVVYMVISTKSMMGGKTAADNTSAKNSTIKATENTATSYDESIENGFETNNSIEKSSKEEANAEESPIGKSLLLLIGGAAVIAVGANLLVDHGTRIATALGIPETVIALTFVALGTSLPELVTAVTSLIKGHSSLSVGNVIGANLFNLVLVSGASITISPFPVPVAKKIAGMNASLVIDLPVMILVMAIMIIPALIKGKLARWQGILLLGIYMAYCGFQFVN